MNTWWGSCPWTPRSRDSPPLTRGGALARLVNLAHRECDVSACHMLSFMWGSGQPAMYEPPTLPATHERMGDLCRAGGTYYYRHVSKMVQAGHAVKCDPGDPRHARPPDDYLADAAQLTTPMLLLTGDRNRVFADSNIVCHQLLSKIAPGPVRARDPAGLRPRRPDRGPDAHTDVFPRIGEFLKRQAA